MDYIAPGVQNVALREPVATVSANQCNCGRSGVLHENGTGVYVLRGGRRYQVTGKSNIAVPTGGTVGPIAVGITVNGEIRAGSRAISTPAAVNEYNETTAIATVTVPCGCCAYVAFEPVPASNDPTVTPAPVISMQDTLVRIIPV
jgi:hypothetical protein